MCYTSAKDNVYERIKLRLTVLSGALDALNEEWEEIPLNGISSEDAETFIRYSNELKSEIELARAELRLIRGEQTKSSGKALNVCI